jgi:hypothetical protein
MLGLGHFVLASPLIDTCAVGLSCEDYIPKKINKDFPRLYPYSFQCGERQVEVILNKEMIGGIIFVLFADY